MPGQIDKALSQSRRNRLAVRRARCHSIRAARFALRQMWISSQSCAVVTFVSRSVCSTNAASSSCSMQGGELHSMMPDDDTTSLSLPTIFSASFKCVHDILLSTKQQQPMASRHSAQDCEQAKHKQEHVESVGGAECRVWVVPRTGSEPAVQN